ncbi:type II toxin-antitoxin system CcdA family antitoxin [Niveibacterium sp. SC-1]|uniref:type II toxin-antitoxin system CcdA family antitoxin n=1 Tax=Niveibacterium sp. SC-1 TaxID=3135646 RepID=UPI00311D500B
MKTSTSQSSKRPVNLLLSDETVRQARQLTDNLSATVDQLLADFIAQRRDDQVARRQADDAVAEYWNRFEDVHGSFADEHQIL